MLRLQLQKSPTANFEEKCGNSLDISKGISQSGIWKFESSKVSQAVTQPSIALLKIEESPVDSALSSTNGVSNLAKNTQPERENGKSLWRILEIFPFFGDARRRLARSALRGVGRSLIQPMAMESKSKERQPPFDAH
jgi:hypothetical protein